MKKFDKSFRKSAVRNINYYDYYLKIYMGYDALSREDQKKFNAWLSYLRILKLRKR